MHDFKTLAADISALLKTSGPTGDSGDTRLKPLNVGVNLGTTREDQVSPLDLRVVPAAKMTGDAKVESHHSLRPSVTSVTSVTTVTTHSTRGERESAAELQALRSTHIPEHWREGFRRLRDADPIDIFHPHAWSAMVADAATFLATWGDQVARLGWRDVDVFGLNSDAPWTRVGCWGLVFLIQAGAVVAVTDTSAAIRRTSGASLTWHRGDGPQVPAWELVGGAR